MTTPQETENFEPDRAWLCAECGDLGEIGEQPDCRCAIDEEEELHA